MPNMFWSVFGRFADSRPTLRFIMNRLHAKKGANWATLEVAPRQFLMGFRFALHSQNSDEIKSRLDEVENNVRGFTEEGVTSGLAMMDAWSRRPYRVLDFMDGAPADYHPLYFTGIGHSLAVLPQRLWARTMPTDSMWRWMALDGYGFQRTLINPWMYLHRQYTRRSYPGWPDDPGYAPRAVDQGIGRAIWFFSGADPGRVETTMEPFDAARREDLWSGVGLASAYAGGTGEDELRRLAAVAGEHRPSLAQGAAFSVKLRALKNGANSHTPIAARVLCGDTIEQVAHTFDVARAAAEDGSGNRYEALRTGLREHFTRRTVP